MNVQEPHVAARVGGPKRRNNLFHRRQQAIALMAAAVAEQLAEPNRAGIARLMEIFGADFVRGIADRARERFDQAQAAGPEAYQAQAKGSAVATSSGEPRSPGGVFFYLMREHATSIGIDWLGLYIPSPRGHAPTQPQPVQAAPEAATAPQAAPLQATAAVSKPAAADVINNTAKEASANAMPAEVSGAVKPNRIKATVVGAPIGEPKPTDQPGVLQLVFEVEMTPTMPKGLPTLGRSRVIVLCTEKQYRQAQGSESASGRMIVDGEAATTLSTAGKPLLLVVCTRLTTPELEQAKHKS